jgi:hypothetical protein
LSGTVDGVPSVLAPARIGRSFRAPVPLLPGAYCGMQSVGKCAAREVPFGMGRMARVNLAPGWILSAHARDNRRKLRTARYLQLLKYAAQVILDRLVAQPQRLADFLVGHAFGHQRQDFLLLRRQRMGA